MLNHKNYMKYTKQQLIEMLVKEQAIAISEPSDLYAPILAKLDSIRMKEQECFVSVSLNGAHEILGFYTVSLGLANRTLVHPREVFRNAIKDNAVAIIIAHNHPSGNLKPSIEDKDVTKRMKLAGDVIGIKVIDHLIVSPALGYFSFLEKDIF